MSLVSAGLLFALVVPIVGGAFVLDRGPRRPTNLAFAWFSLWMAYWAFVHLGLSLARDQEEALFFVQLGMGWPFALAAGLIFVLSLTERDRVLRSPWLWLGLHVPAAAFVAAQIGLDLLDAAPERTPWGWTPGIPSPNAVFEAGNVWAIAICAIQVALAVHYAVKGRNPARRRQVRALLAGLLIGPAGTVVETLSFELGSPLPGLNVAAITVGYFFLGYAMWRRDLFALTPATAAETIVATMADMLLLVRPDGEVVSANRAVADGLGALREDLEGSHVGQIVGGGAAPPDWLEPVLSQRPGSPERIGDVEASLRGRDGREVPVSMSATVLRNEGGTFVGVLLVARDITGRKRAEQERLASEGRAKETEKAEALGRLAGGVAHDFNNLLTTILGHATLSLETQTHSAVARESLEAIVKAAKRAAAISTQMLAYSGRGKFVVGPVDLAAIAAAAVARVAQEKGRRAPVVAVANDGVPPVLGDRAELLQAVSALVHNGLEAVDGTGGEVLVRTGALPPRRGSREGATHAFVEVSDTGVGMDEETRARMFEPFFTTKFMGRGLGLAATEGIVKGHNGTISVETAPGRGTTVRIVFPKDPTEDERGATDDDAHDPRESEGLGVSGAEGTA